ncbi:hypothetical protein [uncultured Nostoc sp.]|uniref:hypothetical protein n=1 Tax=uncultured Nostoc sp. TaxID=340711 RepID=UPI0035CC6AAA
MNTDRTSLLRGRGGRLSIEGTFVQNPHRKFLLIIIALQAHRKGKSGVYRGLGELG